MGHTDLFFGISLNIGIFHFQYWTYKCPKIWDIRHSGILTKKSGTHKKRQKMKYSGFLEYSGIFNFLNLGQGGRVKFNQVTWSKLSIIV